MERREILSDRLLGATDYVSTQIQPPLSAIADHQGPLGGGWKGVLKWCEHIGSSSEGFAGSTVMANVDYLVIHVDADIASENELQPHALSEPCPPAKATTDKIRSHLISLLGGTLPPNVVFCVPAQCTEAWVFAALHPNELTRFQPIECRPNVHRLLINKPDRLVSATSKNSERYRIAASRIAREWQNATTACPEASRFETEFKAAIQSP